MINYIPEWTDEDTQIIKDYERRKKEGTLKEYVLIERGDTEEMIKERFDRIIGNTLVYATTTGPLNEIIKKINKGLSERLSELLNMMK